MTHYTTFIQLSRNGAGGAGFPGPEASFSTQMLDLPLPSGVRLVPESQTSLSLSWDRVIGPGSATEDWTYQVECVQSSDPGTIKTYQLPANSTGLKLPDLKPRHKYECRVRMMTVSVGQHSQPVSAWTLSNGNENTSLSGLTTRGPVEDDLSNDKESSTRDSDLILILTTLI
uniref:Fibronectin type-III domain-containing protein n=1 Tax=Hucho hucho TaxID=62062 RepID=A0A4W5KAL5_9TELE